MYAIQSIFLIVLMCGAGDAVKPDYSEQKFSLLLKIHFLRRATNTNNKNKIAAH
jgi:hypothetical protein